MRSGPQVTAGENYPVAPSGELQPTDRALLLTLLTNPRGAGEGKRRSSLRPENASLLSHELVPSDLCIWRDSTALPLTSAWLVPRCHSSHRPPSQKDFSLASLPKVALASHPAALYPLYDIYHYLKLCSDRCHT